ncbi:MAG TPA: sigma-70 family RNA polymerase sigma factor [Vicinamibacterales bacterium]
MTTQARTVTILLQAWCDGDGAALNSLVPLVEAELRRQARIYMSRERRGHTLQPTALVNEVFMRLVGAADIRWQDRAHFFGISARLMRRVLVDHARARGYRKRGGDMKRITLDGRDFAAADSPVDLLALDRALDGLTAVDERKARVVEMRFFAGLTVEETAAALDVSIDTVKRDWRIAKLWLLNFLEGEQSL